MILTLASVVAVLVHGAAVLSLLLHERRAPTATLAWMLALLLVPFVGVVVWLVFGRTSAKRVAERYADVTTRVERALEPHAVRSKIAGEAEARIEPRTEGLLRLTAKLASAPASHGNRTELLIDGRATYEALAEAIGAATDHVHVEFYIVRDDVTGQLLRDLLVAVARSGVEVRVVVDGLGSAHLPWDFWQPLVDAGGHAAFFRPVGPILARLPMRDRVDFRNHRKLVVVDGRVGFTGGINVGREYLGLDPAMGNWRDTHVRIDGPAVLALQKVFAEDWLHATDELLCEPRYFPDPVEAGDDHVQIVDSGPDRSWSPIERAFTFAFAHAHERIWITSPYFVPSQPVEDALASAALRGVDVRVLVPLRSDSRLVTYAARSYFPSLLEAGVRVFEYRRGFVHAKTTVVDDWVASVGSANMDVRSFHLNYELDAFVLGGPITARLAEEFERDLDHAEELTEPRSGIVPRLLQATARLLSPLL